MSLRKHVAAPELPLATAPEEVRRPRFVRRGFRLNARQWADLCWQADAADLPPAIVLCAAYADVLGCWSASRRFTVNLTIPCWSPIPLACDLAAGRSFAERAVAVQRQFRADFEHRLFSGIRWELANTGVPAGFTSLLGDTNLDAVARAGDTARTSRVYLDVQVLELAGELVVHWDAIDELFPPGLLDDMVAAYERLVCRLAKNGSAWR